MPAILVILGGEHAGEVPHMGNIGLADSSTATSRRSAGELAQWVNHADTGD
ncbi:hypothetical protein ACFPM7_27990 [Actinokineospora guangxiensis]|uniref:Uncharacterized protein n=1 Tax=Actinokineospora guangxiensis TaxID=1490288 RepID=A0ABW0EX18_9PSEU